MATSLFFTEPGVEYNPGEPFQEFRNVFSNDSLGLEVNDSFDYGPTGMQRFFKMVDGTLSSEGFGESTLLLDGVFSYCRSDNFGYLRIRQEVPAKEATSFFRKDAGFRGICQGVGPGT